MNVTVRIVGIVFEPFPPYAGDARWVVGAVVEFEDGTGEWGFIALHREAWIPCPAETLPETILAALHERLTQSRN